MSGAALGEAAAAAATLKYLDGGHRDGCNDEDDRFTQRRRVFHQLTSYGFLFSLRRDVRRDAVSLRVRVAGAVRLLEPA